MTTSEIIYELQSLAETGQGSEVTMREIEAMRAAVPILKRAETDRIALQELSKCLYHPSMGDAELALRIVMEALESGAA